MIESSHLAPTDTDVSDVLMSGLLTDQVVSLSESSLDPSSIQPYGYAWPLAVKHVHPASRELSKLAVVESQVFGCLLVLFDLLGTRRRGKGEATA